MVLYYVHWSLDMDIAKPNIKGRLPSKHYNLIFSCICRNRVDALCCLDYHFRSKIPYELGLSPDDGSIKLQRIKVDSRNFNADYLFMDGVKEPILLDDLKSNLLRFNKIF